MKSNEARKQRARSRTKREKERNMREEEEELLRSENVVESILSTGNEKFLAQMERIKIDMRPKISNLFKCNLLEEQRRKNLIELAKCSYNNMNAFMKEHIILNVTLYDYNVSYGYIASIYDDVIEKSVLKTKLSFLEIKKREHDMVRIEPNPTQPKSTQPNPSQSI